MIDDDLYEIPVGDNDDELRAAAELFHIATISGNSRARRLAAQVLGKAFARTCGIKEGE